MAKSECDRCPFGVELVEMGIEAICSCAQFALATNKQITGAAVTGSSALGNEDGVHPIWEIAVRIRRSESSTSVSGATTGASLAFCVSTA